jgi:hypothetical protein
MAYAVKSLALRDLGRPYRGAVDGLVALVTAFSQAVRPGLADGSRIGDVDVAGDSSPQLRWFRIGGGRHARRLRQDQRRALGSTIRVGGKIDSDP